MKRMIVTLFLSVACLLGASVKTNAHVKTMKAGRFRSYMPSMLDYVKPKSWSLYQFTYANWTDPTGNPSPYATYFNWVNKRCQVTGLWLSGSQWYVQLNIPGTAYYVTWPVNYVTTTPATTTDLLVQTI